MSINKAWRGRTFKSSAYKKYERDLPFLLPRLVVPQDVPLEIHFVWGFSSGNDDIDNPLKPTIDILARFYDFNDKRIHRLVVEREKVKKGDEFFSFEISDY